MFTPTTRNPGFVSRRGDDRRITQALVIEPGRWDVFWADGASVSVLAPTEDVARLRAQLRRDQSERVMGQAVTTFLPGAVEPQTPPYARGPVDVGMLTPLPAPPGRYAAVASSGGRARALADAVAAELDERTDKRISVPTPLHVRPYAEATVPAREPARAAVHDPGPAPTLPPRPRSIPIQGAPPRRPPPRPTGGAWIAALAVASTTALVVAGLAVLGALLVMRGAA